MSQQRVSPRDIHQDIAGALGFAVPLRGGDGLAGPVSSVLAHSGQGVEDGAFPDVGVSRYRDYPVVRGAALYFKRGLSRRKPGGARGQSHLPPPSQERRGCQPT